MQTTAIHGLHVRERAPARQHPHFYARITPNKSLTGLQTLVLIAAITSISVALQAALIIIGAWPCAIFLAFDTLFAVGAIIVCQSRMQRHEDVVIADAGVEIRRCDRGVHSLAAREPLFGLTIEMAQDPDFGIVSLHLRNRHGRVEIARDLSPHERADFLAAFLSAAANAGHRPGVHVTHLLTHPVAEASP